MEKLIFLSQKETIEPGEVVFVALQKAFSKVKSTVIFCSFIVDLYN